jgi:hypothetical protein
LFPRIRITRGEAPNEFQKISQILSGSKKNCGSVQHDICQYPEDRVPPHTRSKSKQGARRASSRCHIRCSFGPHLPVEVDSGADMRHAASNLSSLLRRAPVLPRVPQIWTSLLCRGGLRCFHVSHGSELYFPKGRASMLPCLSWSPAGCRP